MTDRLAPGVDVVERAVADLAAGRAVVILDDDAAEGVLAFAADLATPDLVSFMVRHSSGYLCVAITAADAERLDLPPMQSSEKAARARYTVTVDAREGISTGISARDRARTINLLADPQTLDSDLSRPGHVVPVLVDDGGVLRRPGHTEAAVDLVVLAGRRPSAAVCGIVGQSDPTAMACGAEVRSFAAEHGLAVVTIGDVVAYRAQSEHLVRRCATARMPLAAGIFAAIGYESEYDDRQHLALVMGDISDGQDVLVGIHTECLTGDIFGSLRCDCRGSLDGSLAAVAAEGRGLIVYVRADGGRGSRLFRDLRAYQLLDCGMDGEDVDFVLGLPARSRDQGTGAQIIRELGIRTVRLLTDDQSGRNLLAGHGVEIVERVPIPTVAPGRHTAATTYDPVAYALALVAS